ncbi:hypothetical protein BGY98DRAFT_1054923 [Russula aff. rugulosa BPL654]|nr:hypothetical protein BGY98DRAFT_1054923 [Russula aff. rugulosa BPL654]
MQLYKNSVPNVKFLPLSSMLAVILLSHFIICIALLYILSWFKSIQSRLHSPIVQEF